MKPRSQRIAIPILLLMSSFGFGLRSTAHAADGRSLSGTYKDPNVTLTLEPDKDADSYHGSIQTGGQTFKATAHASDGKLTGAFSDKDGNSFDFTAVVEGNSLAFTTANTTYHLLSDRPPPVNPLARPANPLAQPPNPLGGGAAPPPPAPAPEPGEQKPGAVGIQMAYDNQGNIVIGSVLPGGPAALAGLQPGDQIVAVDGIPANDPSAKVHFRGAVGTELKLTCKRNGQQGEFTLTRAAINIPGAPGAAPAPQQPQAKNAGVGFNITIGNDQAIIINGLLPGGPAARAGVQVGDQIVAIDDQPLRGVQDLSNLLPGTAGSSIKLTIRRGQQNIDFTMQREVTNPSPRSAAPAQGPQTAERVADARPTGGAAAEHNYTVAPNTQAILLMPELKTAPPPPWVKPGVRLTYFGGAALVPGAHIVLVAGPDGKLVNKATGQTFSIEDNIGGGGLGMSQLDVVAVHDDAVVTEVTSYIVNNGNQGPLTVTTEAGYVSTPGAAGDSWINPEVLRKYANLNGEGVVSYKTNYKAADKQFNALWRTVTGQDSSLTYVYDLDGGVLLHTATCASTASTPFTVNGVTQDSGGGTNLSQSTLINQREIKTPWTQGRTAHALDGVHRFKYEGIQQVMLPDGSVSPAGAVSLEITVAGRGGDFVQLHREGTLTIGGNPLPFTSDVVSGPAQLMPIAVEPADLAKLQQGQVLDRDPATQFVTTVSFVGHDAEVGDIVAITTAAPGQGQQRVDCAYDQSTGLLVGSSITNPLLGQVTRIKLVGKE